MDHAASLPKRKRKKKRKKKLPRSGNKFLPRSRRLFGTNSTLFLREGRPWLLRSILAASCPHGSLQAQDARHLGRYGPEGHLCCGTEFASVARAVRTSKPGLSTSHWYLAVTCSVLVLPEEHRKLWSFLGDAYAELFLRPLVSGSHLCGVFYDHLYLTVTCSAFALGVRVFGFFWKMTSGISVCSTPWSTVDTCLASVYEGFLASTLQKTAESPQLQFFDGRRHSLRYAEADSHGPAVDYRDCAVAVRAGWSMSLVCKSWRFQFCGCTFSMWSSTPLSLSRVYPMVQTVRLTWDSPVASIGGRRPCLQVEQVHFPVVAQRQVP